MKNIFGFANRKGLSGIVTAIIIIGISLAIIGIVWYVIDQAITGQTENIALSEKCLDIYVQVKSTKCNATWICNVTLSRKAGGVDMAGLKMMFKNDAGNTSSVVDVPGNIEPLQTVTKTGIDSEISNATSVEVTIYLNESSTDQICPQTKTYEF